MNLNQYNQRPSVASQLANQNNLRVILNQTSQGIELLLFDDIGQEGTNAKSVATALMEHSGKPINVRINSVGGASFDGVTIYNSLRNHNAPVTTTIEGVAGSAAAVIAMAGSPVRMQRAGSLFIHRSWMQASGNAQQMLELVAMLQKVDNRSAEIFSEKTGLSEVKIMELMAGKSDGTWFTPNEAKAMNFVDEIIGTKKVLNAIDSIAARLRILEINGNKKSL